MHLSNQITLIYQKEIQKHEFINLSMWNVGEFTQTNSNSELSLSRRILGTCAKLVTMFSKSMQVLFGQVTHYQ